MFKTKNSTAGNTNFRYVETDVLSLMKRNKLEELLAKIQPSRVQGFSTTGNKSTFYETAKTITEDSCIVIGGFQKGHFSQKTLDHFDNLKSLHDDSLDAHVVASRILYEYEKTIFI